ncbi:dnaJ homolog subfamily B member 8 [Cucurbita maxima]|uniref:DnaJ homolog subfamily B member 8 n=1 Tax=Cucurbita maxima TaxID=3661 RepID=A0A6J1HLS8_CUCMA|nr:dnaJ homolog subfamily B member 8 [Cucurbita maxima]XP_022965988.1 dnaJ homolog subfamily B member 8 [Cucurbita maxima]
MDRGGGSDGGSSYYAILGIRKDASLSEIRTAYRMLALKWHPDRCTRNPSVAGEAKRQFQLVQEAYSVLSDQAKRSVYDAGLYDPTEEDDEEFCDFMQEMISMMNSVKPEGDSFEDLQKMFMEMIGSDGIGGFSVNDNPTATKRPRANGSRSSEAKRSTMRR